MMKKRLLFFSNLYPNPALPNQSTFNFQQVQALCEWFDVSVASPIPWTNRVAVRASIAHSSSDPSVVYPTYWYTPRVLRGLYGRMMLASVVSSVRKMHHSKPFNLIFGSWLYPDGWVAVNLAAALRIPCFLKVHGTDVNRLAPTGQLTRASLQAVKQSSGVVCVSQALKSRLISLGANEEKCHVVYNGVNSEVFHPWNKTDTRIQLGFPEQGKIILYVGNLLETKGLGELIAAFGGIVQKRHDVTLVIIGSGSWEKQLKERIDVEGVVERVKILGSIDHENIAMYMNAADILCLPSYMEGVPNVVLESLATDTPVVATSVGGLPELACDDSRILLVPPQDSASLQATLEHVLDVGFLGEQRIVIKSWQENAAAVASIFAGSEVQT